ncbi:hypothetical protein BX600DRAFT_473291 [Xylariales sp. PMI_506]|nr:hypothetical protein BX600DRAFT_473291 [Xylariales sp. PMI_506]
MTISFVLQAFGWLGRASNPYLPQVAQVVSSILRGGSSSGYLNAGNYGHNSQNTSYYTMRNLIDRKHKTVGENGSRSLSCAEDVTLLRFSYPQFKTCVTRVWMIRSSGIAEGDPGSGNAKTLLILCCEPLTGGDCFANPIRQHLVIICSHAKD